MKTATAVIGRLGEALAAEYLRSCGFAVRETNVRFGRFEIDIVAYDPKEKMIVFVEVKTRSRFDPRYPLRTAVDKRKRKAMQAAIFRWANHHRYEGSARIDLLCIAENRVIEHVVDVGAAFF